jgi:hypothetical protein
MMSVTTEFHAEMLSFFKLNQACEAFECCICKVVVKEKVTAHNAVTRTRSKESKQNESLLNSSVYVMSTKKWSNHCAFG